MNMKDLDRIFETIDWQNKDGLIEIVKSGQDLDFIHNLREQTPLICAIDNSWMTGVKILIEAGVDVDLISGPESCPLASAITVNNIEIVEILLQNGADPNSKMYLDTPLHQSITEGKIHIACTLLKAGADPNYRDYDYTPLMVAVQNNNLPFVKTLIEAGANPNMLIESDDGDITALVIAAEQGHLDIYEYLLPLTADEEQRQFAYDQLQTGLLFRARCNNILIKKLIDSAKYNDIQTLESLITHGIDINLFNEEDETALHIASGLGNLEFVERLIFSGVDINKISEQGKTALHVASRFGNSKIIERLVEAGANLNILSDIGDSALEIAIMNRHLDTVKTLLEAGADLTSQMGTLLSLAVDRNSIEVTRVLIDFGVDINEKNSQGLTALELARRCRYSEMVDFLKESGAIGRSDIEPLGEDEIPF